VGKILAHPHPVITDQPYDDTALDAIEPMSREETKAFMKANSIKSGDPKPLATSVARRPFAGELTAFTSPDDPNATFYVKRCGVAENIQRQNQNSTIRYIEGDERGTFTTERTYPIGDLNVFTVGLGLASWNLEDDNGVPLPVNRENIVKYLSPTEFDALHEKIIEVNPMWGRGGEAEVKKA
jgi:hypothetical protein